MENYSTGVRLMKKHAGFTLIELMIVIAIVGIIAAIAIPAYQDYSIRSKVAEGLTLSMSAKQAVAETFQSAGRYPSVDNSSYGLPASASIAGSYVSSVTAAALTGIITVEYKLLAPGKVNSGDTVTLTPVTVVAGALGWVCSSNTIPPRFVPANCR
jgi:type IV pilus assembly protein PilA